MKTLLRWLAVSVVSLVAATASYAQGRFSQAELDQALAPVALYPDSLLSQLLMAATYPSEVAEAALWSRSNPQLTGEEAVRRVENEPWDPSVKSLVAFPQVLAMMGDRPDWVQRLGEMFQSSPELVSDTVQELRRRADEAGNLRSGEEMKVYRDDRYYYIEPPSPEVVYVPYYDPRVVYGRWWWPSYEPIWWRPWAGYRWYPGYTGFGWGYGITLGHGFFYSSFDWPRRYIFFRDTWPRYHRGWDHRHGHRWWHDRDRRHWGDRDRDGRWDGRRRDGDRDRDGRWDGRRREGDRDRDGRWDGRRRDGDRDRDGRWDGRRRDGDRRGSRDWAPAPGVAQPAVQSPIYRRSDQPVVMQPAAPVGRSAPERAPAPVVANPVGRSAPEPAREPSRDWARARESVPRESAAREAAAREAAAREAPRSDDRPSGGRGGGERSRER